MRSRVSRFDARRAQHRRIPVKKLGRNRSWASIVDMVVATNATYEHFIIVDKCNAMASARNANIQFCGGSFYVSDVTC
jgi:hypothetical protein